MVVAFADDHRLARSTRPVALAALAEEAWVVIRGGSAAREQFDRITDEAGFQPKIRFETESYDVAQALVATGYGVALVSRMARRTDLGLAHRSLQHRSAHRTIHTLRQDEHATGLTLPSKSSSTQPPPSSPRTAPALGCGARPRATWTCTDTPRSCRSGPTGTRGCFVPARRPCPVPTTRTTFRRGGAGTALLRPRSGEQRGPGRHHRPGGADSTWSSGSAGSTPARHPRDLRHRPHPMGREVGADALSLSLPPHLLVAILVLR